MDQIYRQAQANVDAITADYLAEFNIAYKAIERASQPDLGYESAFLAQLAYKDGDAARLIARNNIKVVHDGGALNPRGLAEKAAGYFRSLGIEGVKIAWVEGDDVTALVKEDKLGEIKHLDIEGTVLSEEERGKVMSANVYTGMTGIVKALEAGADIVVCGRCTDASPVMGLAAWWHQWKETDYTELAGALLAGHLIECSAYVTGGNYCGFQEVKDLHRVGYPIAEIAADGTAVITKPEGSNGAVTVDTCKAQLLYEIQGIYYLNPDVQAIIDGAILEDVGKDRVRLSGIKGAPPPPTLKLAIFLKGGWQAELSAFASGLDIQEKFSLMKDQVKRELDLAAFTTLSMEVYGSTPPDPKSQAECTAMLRMFAQAETQEPLGDLMKAIAYNSMQGYCGLHLSMDWRTMIPKPVAKYFPSLVSAKDVNLSVRFVDDVSNSFLVPIQAPNAETMVPPKQPSYNPTCPTLSFGTTVRRPFGDLVFARSGDKGGNANAGFWVRDQNSWEWLRSFLALEKMVELLGNDWKPEYQLERVEFGHLWAVHFVVKGLLKEGISSSSVLDGFGKSVAEFVRARVVDLPVKLVENEDMRRKNMRGAKVVANI